MKLSGNGSTDQSLLSEVANWENHAAWARFRATYDPSLRRWCRRYGLNNDSIEEVCQLIWIELAHRMRTFEYDPSRTFQGWLRRLCESRVLNFLRQRRATPLVSLDERDFDVSPGTTGISADDEVPKVTCTIISFSRRPRKSRRASERRLSPIHGMHIGLSLFTTGASSGLLNRWA